jgi:hypothetical protein
MRLLFAARGVAPGADGAAARAQVNTIEEVETEEDELTKQLASFSAYQRSLGLAAAEVKDPEPAPAKGIWQAFNPWDFNALPSVETSLAELKAGGVLGASPCSNRCHALRCGLTVASAPAGEEQCESFRNRRFVRYQKDYILTRGEIVAMAKAIYDNGNFHSFDRDYEMRKFIHSAYCHSYARVLCGGTDKVLRFLQTSSACTGASMTLSASSTCAWISARRR